MGKPVPPKTLLFMRLTDEQVNKQADLIVEMFVRALVLGTDKVENEAHKISPCPIVIWEDFHSLDDTGIDLMTPKRSKL